ncbi:MAG: hypothetical protein MJZ23_01305 [Paludibacteraceae bacterium]|nr:hypothetical protein [Paludibacteraceae bacterium]
MTRKFKNLFCMLGLGLLAQTAMAEGCDVVVGGTDFVDKAQSDTLLVGDFNQLITKGVDGGKFGSGILVHADSAQQLTNNYEFSAYGVTTNTQLIDPTYNKVENALVLHLSSDAKGGDQLLFTYQVNGLKPGSDYEVSFTVTLLNGPENELAKELEKRYKLGQSGINVYTNPDGYGNSGTKPAGMTDADLSFNKKYVIPVTIKGTLKAHEESVQLYLKTNYNFSAGLTLAISDLTVKGCYDSKVISNDGLNVCLGEQALFTLDKDYEAATYKWMMQAPDESSFYEIGNEKQVSFEIEEEGAYTIFCELDGMTTKPVEVNAKVCCINDEGNPLPRQKIFQEDFGYFTDLRTYVDANGNVTITPDTFAPERADVNWNLSALAPMTFDYKGQINDGYYGVIVPHLAGGYYQDVSGLSLATWMSGVKSDHSSLETGKKGGAALFMNVADMFTGVFFSKKITGLCAYKSLTAETYIANLSGGTDPEVELRIRNAKTLETIASKRAIAVSSMEWEPLYLNFNNADAEEILFELLTVGGEGDSTGRYWKVGDDLIVDDIRLWACVTPNITLFANVESKGEITLEAPASKILKGYYSGNEHYLYQLSTDGKNWQNIAKPTTDSKYVIATKELAADTNYYRVVVADKMVLDLFAEYANAPDGNDICRNFSVSSPIKVVSERDLLSEPTVLGETEATSYYIADGKLVVNATEGSQVALYTPLGLTIASEKATSNSLTFNTKGQDIVILVVDGKAYKVVTRK